MKVEIEVDTNINETIVKIKTNKVTEEIQVLADKIQNVSNSKNVVASEDNKLHILNFDDIESIYSSGGKVIVRKDNKEYISKKRLYEFEEILEQNYKNYIRISNSEIVNFKKVNSLDLSITGTIELVFKSGYITYVSRRNIKRIKEYLKI